MLCFLGASLLSFATSSCLACTVLPALQAPWAVEGLNSMLCHSFCLTMGLIPLLLYGTNANNKDLSSAIAYLCLANVPQGSRARGAQSREHIPMPSIILGMAPGTQVSPGW